jgi:hypothetical protein
MKSREALSQTKASQEKSDAIVILVIRLSQNNTATFRWQDTARRETASRWEFGEPFVDGLGRHPCLAVVHPQPVSLSSCAKTFDFANVEASGSLPPEIGQGIGGILGGTPGF